MSPKLINIISGRNAHMNDIWDAVLGHIATHLPRGHDAWIMVGIMSNGVGQMVYDLDTNPLLKLRIKSLTSEHILKCMGLESAMLRRYAQLYLPQHISLLDDYSRLIFPQSSDAFMRLLEGIQPPRLYLEYFTRYSEFTGRGGADSPNPCFDMITVMGFRQLADRIFQSRIATIASKPLQK